MAKIAKVVECIRTDLQDMKVVEAARKANVKNGNAYFNVYENSVYVYMIYIIDGLLRGCNFVFSISLRPLNLVD